MSPRPGQQCDDLQARNNVDFDFLFLHCKLTLCVAFHIHGDTCNGAREQKKNTITEGSKETRENGKGRDGRREKERSARSEDHSATSEERGGEERKAKKRRKRDDATRGKDKTVAKSQMGSREKGSKYAMDQARLARSGRVKG